MTSGTIALAPEPAAEPTPTFAIEAYWPTVVIRCKCDAKSTLVLLGTKAPIQCNACRQIYMIYDEMQVKVGPVSVQIKES